MSSVSASAAAADSWTAPAPLFSCLSRAAPGASPLVTLPSLPKSTASTFTGRCAAQPTARGLPPRPALPLLCQQKRLPRVKSQHLCFCLSKLPYTAPWLRQTASSFGIVSREKPHVRALGSVHKPTIHPSVSRRPAPPNQPTLESGTCLTADGINYLLGSHPRLLGILRFFLR